jgi:hypothetical protein
MCDSPKSRADHAAYACRAAQGSVGDLSQVRLSQQPRIPEIHPVGGPRVTAGLFPVLRRLDLGVYIGMDLEQVEQVAAGQEFKRLIFGRTRTMLCRSRRSPMVSPWPILSSDHSRCPRRSARSRAGGTARNACRSRAGRPLPRPWGRHAPGLAVHPPVSPPKVGLTSPAFPIDNMYKCPELAYVKSAWRLAPPWRVEPWAVPSAP